MSCNLNEIFLNNSEEGKNECTAVEPTSMFWLNREGSRCPVFLSFPIAAPSPITRCFFQNRRNTRLCWWKCYEPIPRRLGPPAKIRDPILNQPDVKLRLDTMPTPFLRFRMNNTTPKVSRFFESSDMFGRFFLSTTHL